MEARASPDRYSATRTFKCEGCGQRFPESQLWKPHRKWHVGDVCTVLEKQLANYVCSRQCAAIAKHEKLRRGETLLRLQVLTALQEGATVDWIVHHFPVSISRVYTLRHKYY